MLSRSLGTLVMVILLATATLSSVAIAQQPGHTSSPPPTSSPTGPSVLTPYTFSGTVSGIASYVAGSDKGTSFDLPLVRTDLDYDTIIHVANASSTPTTVTITLFDQNGVAQPAYVSPPLPGWASLDYDVQTQFAPNFSPGSATIVSSVSPIVVTGTVLNSAVADNVDSYSEVPGNSTVPAASTNITYLPLLPSCTSNGDNCAGGTDTPTVYLHNSDSASPANANLTFYWTNPPSGQPAPTPVTATVSSIPPNGEGTLAVNSVAGISGFNFDAATQIQSNKPLAVAVDENGNGAGFWAAAPTPSNTGSTFYVPRFDYQAPKQNLAYWTTGLVLLNVASVPQTFTVRVYTSDGQLTLQQAIANVPPMGVGKFNYGGVNQNLNLPDGFVGSAVVTSQASAVAWFAKYYLATFAEAIYFTPTAPPTGTTVVVPAVRKNGLVFGNSTASTAFSIQNPSDSNATYTISFRDMSGTLVYSQNVTFPPHAMWYVSQAADPKLPNGFTGSAQIVNAAGGPLPIVAVDTDGGRYAPGPTLPPPKFHVYVPFVSRGN